MSQYVPHWVRYLVEAGRLAPSADNSQPWQFILESDKLRLAFEPKRGNALGPDHPAILLAFGCIIENLIQAAQAVGMDTTQWLTHHSLEGQDFLHIPTPKQDLNSSSDIPAIIRMRHTNRGPFRTDVLANELIEEIQSYHEGTVYCQLFCNQIDITRLAQLVQLASELRFQTEEVHRWLAASLRFTEEEIARCDGLDVNTLALPPGGKLLSRFLADWRHMTALNHLGAHKLLARIEAAQFTRTSAIVVLLSDQMNNADWLNAGRLMERIWLLLTAYRISVQPYFVLPDQIHRRQYKPYPRTLASIADELMQQTSDLFNSKPLMLLRIGKAIKSPSRSLRLPSEAILKVATTP